MGTKNKGSASKQKRLVIDVGACSRCGACVELAPGIFRVQEAARFIEIIELDDYDEHLVAEAIKYCPENCIYWEEDGW